MHKSCHWFFFSGKKKDSLGRAFWDLVVITTADEAQKEAFQLQIDEKFRRHELPVDLTVHVVPDPPGVRTGNIIFLLLLRCLLSLSHKWGSCFWFSA